MIVELRENQGNQLGIITSYEYERYDSQSVANHFGMGYQATNLSHKAIDTVGIIGRKSGECSIVLDSASLEKFSVKIFSQRLYGALMKKTAVVAYPLGNGYFFCASSLEFMRAYERKVKVVLDGAFKSQ